MADISKRLEKAEKFLKKGRVDSALEQYLSVLDSDPGNDDVRQAAADLFVQLNRSQEAAALLSELFDRQIAAGDNAKAAVNYKKFARLTPPSLGQTLRFAQVSERSGNQREALEAYQAVAKGFSDAGRDNEALNAVRHLVALDPTPAHLKRQAELAAKLNDHPTAGDSFLKIGAREEADGHIAFSWYERAYQHDPANPEIAFRYGKGLLDKGQTDKAIDVLEPAGRKDASLPEYREAYARALVAAHRPAEACPILLQIFENNPSRIEDFGGLIGELLAAQHHDQALELARKLEAVQQQSGKRREFVTFIREITQAHSPDAQFLEYMVELFNSANREHDYCDALVHLFQLRFAAGDFVRAADALDRAAEVDPYLPGLAGHLELLHGKVDAHHLRAIGNRLQKAAAKADNDDDGQPAAADAPVEKESTILEDLMLQAEIFLQYSMRSKAVERLERIQKLFPHEEEKNEKLRELYLNSAVVPQYAKTATAAATASNVSPESPEAEVKIASNSRSSEDAVDNFARVTEITRNVYRQSNVKGVLFAAVNDVGRHWNASRCVAGLCSPGKPPSAALEYCAPGITKSDVMSIVRLIATLQNLTAQHGSVVIEDAAAAKELAGIQEHVKALELKSVMAVPLMDGDEHVGIVILEQCDRPRDWRATDVVVARTIADQMVLAVNNARLRNLMKTLAVTDEKSGLLKRASYIDVMLAEIKRALQQDSATTLMLLNFGKVNALRREAGEAAVEGMMQNIGQAVCSNIRQTDTALMYDPTTIALVLGDTTDKNAFFVVDKMRKVFANMKAPGDRPVTLSAGIAGAVVQPRYDPVDIVTEVINRAEQALEIALTQGPNSAHSLAPVGESAAVA